MEGRTEEPTAGRNRNSLAGLLNKFRVDRPGGRNGGDTSAQSASAEPDSAFFRIFFNSSAKPLFLMMRLKLDR